MQRIVRRSDLRSDSSSSSGSPQPEADNAFHKIPQFDYVERDAEQHDADKNDGRDHEEDMAFNLFAPSRSAKTGETQPGAANKVRLRSPSVDTTRQGFLGNGRDRSYYFADQPSIETEQNYAASALSGGQVQAQSQSPWPGSHYDWKVLKISSSQQSKDVLSSAPLLFRKLVDGSETTKRTRPGKKYRIRLRTKRAALLSKQEAAKAAADAKEVAAQEKKTRRNREKKVKKRARDKAKLATGGGDVASIGAGEEDGEDT